MTDSTDEVMHPVGTDPAWSESYYFNFVDPESRIAMFSRMGFRPNNGWADGLHVVYLGGDRVAFTYGRREIGTELTQYDDDLRAGDLTFVCEKPFEQWRIGYDGPAQDIDDAGVLLQRRKQRPEGWYRPAQLNVDVVFDALTQPQYSGAGERGHFEQSGAVSGSVQLGSQRHDVNGFGVRDKSWGPRDWGGSGSSPAAGEPRVQTGGPAPFVNWFSMNFGREIALGGSCFRNTAGEMRGGGWYQESGESLDLQDVLITTEYQPDSILHRAVRLTASTSAGKQLDIRGNVLTVCPTKIPSPGGATFVNEGLIEVTMDGRTGYGIAEHWHNVEK